MGEDLRRGTGFEDDGGAIDGSEVDAVFCGDGRRVNVSDPRKTGMSVDLPAGLDIATGETSLIMAKIVDEPFVEEERGHIGRVATFDPLDLIGSGDVSGGSGELDSHDGLLFVARAGDEDAILGNGTGNDIVGEAAAFPNDFSILEIVASNAIGGGDDYLR